MKVYKIGEEILRKNTEKITVFDTELEELVQDMFLQMRVSNGVGLAAPQVGINKKLFVIEAEGKQMAFVNPQIIETSEEQSSYEEGCLSIPGVYKEIIRPKNIEVVAQDIKGKRFRIKADNFLARVIQHENDHLNGILFVDHLNDEEREVIMNKYNKLEKRKNRWKKN